MSVLFQCLNQVQPDDILTICELVEILHGDMKDDSDYANSVHLDPGVLLDPFRVCLGADQIRTHEDNLDRSYRGPLLIGPPRGPWSEWNTFSQKYSMESLQSSCTREESRWIIRYVCEIQDLFNQIGNALGGSLESYIVDQLQLAISSHSIDPIRLPAFKTCLVEHLKLSNESEPNPELSKANPYLLFKSNFLREIYGPKVYHTLEGQINELSSTFNEHFDENERAPYEELVAFIQRNCSKLNIVFNKTRAAEVYLAAFEVQTAINKLLHFLEQGRKDLLVLLKDRVEKIGIHPQKIEALARLSREYTERAKKEGLDTWIAFKAPHFSLEKGILFDEASEAVSTRSKLKISLAIVVCCSIVVIAVSSPLWIR